MLYSSVSENEWNEWSINRNAIICGKYAYSYVADSEGFRFSYEDASIEDTDHYIITQDLYAPDYSSQINCFGFIPEKYLIVNHSDNTNYKCYDIRECKTDFPQVSGTFGLYEVTGTNNLNYPYNLKMTKADNEDCYLAVFYSREVENNTDASGVFLEIYKVGSNEDRLVSYKFNLSEPKIKEFRVLKDGSFYVEITNSSWDTGTTITSTEAYIFVSGTTNTAKATSPSTSKRRNCYVDSNNQLYRYDSDSKSIVKTQYTSSSSTLDSTNILKSYKFEDSGTSTSGSDNDINGVIGFEENADAVTIYAY